MTDGFVGIYYKAFHNQHLPISLWGDLYLDGRFVDALCDCNTLSLPVDVFVEGSLCSRKWLKMPYSRGLQRQLMIVKISIGIGCFLAGLILAAKMSYQLISFKPNCSIWWLLPQFLDITCLGNGEWGCTKTFLWLVSNHGAPLQKHI